MFLVLIFTYVLGGLTLVPLLALGALTYAYYTSDTAPVAEHTKVKHTYTQVGEADDTSTGPAATFATGTQRTNLKTWLTVRRTFEASPSTYISIVRTLLDSRSANLRRVEDAFYAVLKGKILYLYEDEVMSECTAVIDITRCDVRIFPEAGLLDGELFAKRNAIRITQRDNSPDIIPDNSSSPSKPSPWYIFFRSVTVMEDWYFALLVAQDPIPPPYPHAAHAALISSLDALPDLIPTRWLNALIGRLFLGVKATTAVENWVIARLMKKLAKVKTPGFLSRIVVRSFEAGDVAPVLSKPMLKELTPEGEASVGVDVSYVAPPGGEMRITISATATISLPSTSSLSILGFSGKNKDTQKENNKPYEVSLVLAVVVRRVEGNMLFKIKRPPSNRLWYAFTTMPHMEMTVEPVVSDRQIRWGMVLSGIEGKLREVIQESVVLPYMDDVPFFDTTPFDRRGGIFADAFIRPDGTAAEGSSTTTTTTAVLPTANATATATTTVMTTTTTTTAPTDPSTCLEEHDRLKQITERNPAQLHRSKSADTLAVTDEKDISSTHLEVGGAAAGAESIGATGNFGSIRKRRTWFGKLEDAPPDAEHGEESKHKSRQSGDYTSPSAGVQILVAPEDSERGRSPVQQHEEDDEGARMILRRTQGSRSVSSPRSTSPQLPFGDSPSSGAVLSRSLPTSSAPSVPGSSLSTPASASPPPSATTSSFLASLKSRGAVMAEKPALKEAMRKWGVGVNWAAGLRKADKEAQARETNGARGERGRERERERETDLMELELEADHGEVWSRSRGDQSPRGSYADLRRKVEMREKDRERNKDEGEDRGGQSSASGSVTRPIDIPGAEKAGPIPVTPDRHHHSSSRSSSSGSSPSVRKVSPPNGTPFLSPSAPRTTTELHTSLRAQSPSPLRAGSETSPKQQTLERRSSHGSTTGKFPPVEDSPTLAPVSLPIRAQPKAAAMVIPGIHAKHKGEVMALGSEPEPKTKTSSTEVSSESPTPTGKTIQNVYRLFRVGNGGSGGVTQGQSQSQGEEDASLKRGVTPGTTQTAKFSPTPPPLPPRTQTQTRESNRATTLSSPVSEILVTVESPTPSASSFALSPASQALKNVVEQDAARQPPPLPVRKPTEQSLSSPSDDGDSRSIHTSPATSLVLSRSPSLDHMSTEIPVLEEQDPSAIPWTQAAQAHEKWKPPLPSRSSSLKTQQSVSG